MKMKEIRLGGFYLLFVPHAVEILEKGLPRVRHVNTDLGPRQQEIRDLVRVRAGERILTVRCGDIRALEPTPELQTYPDVAPVRLSLGLAKRISSALQAAREVMRDCHAGVSGVRSAHKALDDAIKEVEK